MNNLYVDFADAKKIEVKNLEISHTYGGFLEGSPKFATDFIEENNHLWEREKGNKIFPYEHVSGYGYDSLVPEWQIDIQFESLGNYVPGKFYDGHCLNLRCYIATLDLNNLGTLIESVASQLNFIEVGRPFDF